MRVHVIKASPRGAGAGSSRLADAFIRGLKSGGAEVTEILLKAYRIEACTGCFSCWTRTPGVCIHRDDMPRLLEMEAAADMVVVATPLYTYSVPGPLKTYLDRRLPTVEPFLVARKQGTISKHPTRNGSDPFRLFVISTAGFPEPGHFDALELMFKKSLDLTRGDTFHRIFIAGAEMLYNVKEDAPFESLFALFETAGLEMVRDRDMSPGTVAALQRIEEEKFANRESFRNIANAYWQDRIAQSTKTEGDISPARKIILTGNEKRCRHADGGMASLMAGMADLYDPTVEENLSAVFQFDFEDEHYFIVINDGAAVAYKGVYDDADMVVRSPKQVWDAISCGAKNGETALMNGEYTVEGNMSFIMKLDRLFGGRENAPSTQPNAEAPVTDRGPIHLSGGLWLTVAFIPWMVQWILGSVRGDGIPYLASALVSLVIFLYHFGTNRTTLFEKGTLLYALVALPSAFFGAELFLKWQWVFSNLYLGGLWGLSLAGRYSLTAEYMRLDYPKTVWLTDAFQLTNRAITAAWSIYYLFVVLLRILEIAAPIDGLAVNVSTFGSLGLMFGFTAWFQKWFPAKVMGQSTIMVCQERTF